MRSAFITFFSSVGFAIGGWAVPLVFPAVDPFVAKGMLGLAALLLLVAVGLWLGGLRKKGAALESPGNTYNVAAHGEHGTAIGHIENVQFGHQPFVMSDARMVALAQALRHDFPGQNEYTVRAVGGTQSISDANKLGAFLRDSGFEIETAHTGDISPPLTLPIELSGNTILVDSSRLEG